MAVLALVWLWVAWAYFLERYETINWAASYFAAGFAVEAALLVWVGGFRQVSFRLSQDASRAGLAISAFAMFLYPLIAPALGRPWMQSETFGITPDPTAIATLGILLLERGRFRWELSVVPLDLVCTQHGNALGNGFLRRVSTRACRLPGRAHSDPKVGA